MPASPYRDSASGPPRRAAPAAPGVLARQASVQSVLPLAVMAIAFVLPAVQSCEDQVDSAMSVSLRDVATAAWVVPPYLGAALLGACTLFALRLRRSPPAWLAWPSAAVVGAGALASLIAPWKLLQEDHPLTLLALTMLAGAVACVVQVVFAMRKQGWARWTGVVGAHAVLASSVAIFLVSMGVDGCKLRVGAYAYLAAESALVSILVAGVHYRRQTRSLRRRHASLAGVAGGQQAHD